MIVYSSWFIILLVKRILYFASVIILLLIINGLARSTYELWNKQDIITQAERTLAKEKAENERLKNDLKIAKTPEFIESEARNKLFLTKPDEKEVVLPAVTVKEKEKPKIEKPNYQKWLDLFW